MSHRQLFGRYLAADRLHFAAHSHHLWPDVTFAAQQEAWDDAAWLADGKWDRIFGEVVPEAQQHVARRLRLPDPTTIVFAPNTHELVVRLFSALRPPVRVLTTDGEFHSFRRQLDRWEEAGLARVERVPVEPYETFPGRFIEAAHHEPDLVYLSHVMYDSGFVTPGLGWLVGELPIEPVLVVDGYHGFMALPTDLEPIAGRAFYLAGGYKYAMAGEGACFMHCPPGVVPRPVDTGWYAGFGALEDSRGGVAYAADGGRFWGATFDPSGLYRFNAVQRMLDDERIDVPLIHAHVGGLQSQFVDGLGEGHGLGELIPGWGTVGDRGHFLTFRSADAGAVAASLSDAGVVVDRRADRLRIGFGIYHEPDDVDSLLSIVAKI